MGETTREFAIAKTMEILRAYVRKIEDAKEYFDCLSPEGRKIVEDYDKDADGQKTLLLKASESEDFFSGMSDEAVLAYADVCRKINDRFELNVKKVHPIERLIADKKDIWGALQREFNENQTGSEIRGMNAVTQSKTDTEATVFHVGKNIEETEFVSSVEKKVSVDSSEETVTQNAFLVKSEENAIDDSESSNNRIEGYYYFIKNCLRVEESETRYSKNLNILIKDLNMTLASLFKEYNYRENKDCRNKVVSYSFYIKGMRTFVAFVVTTPNYGYSEEAKSISEGISSIFGIDSFIYIRDL